MWLYIVPMDNECINSQWRNNFFFTRIAFETRCRNLSIFLDFWNLTCLCRCSVHSSRWGQDWGPRRRWPVAFPLTQKDLHIFYFFSIALNVIDRNFNSWHGALATVLMGAGYWTTPNANSVSYYLSNEKLSFQNAGKPSIFSNLAPSVGIIRFRCGTMPSYSWWPWPTVITIAMFISTSSVYQPELCLPHPSNIYELGVSPSVYIPTTQPFFEHWAQKPLHNLLNLAFMHFAEQKCFSLGGHLASIHSQVWLQTSWFRLW